VRIYNRALSASEVAALYKGGTAGAAQVSASTQTLQNGTSLSRGLAGLWTFDGPDVTDKVYDRSGQGNNGYFTGGATSSAKAQGHLGQALSFSCASNQYVDMGITSPLNLGSTGTVSAWVKSTDLVSFFPFLVGNFDWAGDRNGYGFATDGPSGTYTLVLADGAGYAPLGSNTPVVDGKWHLITGTWDGTNMRYYTDGILDGGPLAQTITPVSNLYPFRVGQSATDSTHCFTGSLDDIRVYNRALTAAEVKQLYKLGNTTLRP